MSSLVSSQSRLLVVFTYVAHLLVGLYRTIRWFVFERTSRIARLAYQLEQLQCRDQDWCRELSQLNQQYLAQSSEIQQRRKSIALERAKVLEQLSQCVAESNGVKAVPVITCDNIAPLNVRDKVTRPREVNRSTSVEEIIKRFDRPQPMINLTVARQSSISKSRSVSPISFGMNNKPKTVQIPEQTRSPSPRVLTRPEAARLSVTPEPRQEHKNESLNAPESEEIKQTNSNFSKLSGFNLATHRMNEYIDQIMESTIREFKSCDDDKQTNQQSQQFRDTIKELYTDPEWRPFINDLKRQYKIFYYL